MGSPTREDRPTSALKVRPTLHTRGREVRGDRRQSPSSSHTTSLSLTSRPRSRGQHDRRAARSAVRPAVASRRYAEPAGAHRDDEGVREPAPTKAPAPLLTAAFPLCLRTNTSLTRCLPVQDPAAVLNQWVTALEQREGADHRCVAAARAEGRRQEGQQKATKDREAKKKPTSAPKPSREVQLQRYLRSMLNTLQPLSTPTCT